MLGSIRIGCKLITVHQSLENLSSFESGNKSSVRQSTRGNSLSVYHVKVHCLCFNNAHLYFSYTGVAFQTAVGEIITSDLIGRPLGVKDSDSAVNSWTVIGTHRGSGKHGQNFRRDVSYCPGLVTSTKDRFQGTWGAGGHLLA